MSSNIEKDLLPVEKGTLLDSRYEVQAFLGEGTFGKVAKCLDTKTSRLVAVKITKDHPNLVKNALEEIKILNQLQHLEHYHVVQYFGSFFHDKLICLEFELLDQSLANFMKERHYYPLSIIELQPVVHQLTTAFAHLKTLNIIHADLKADNVMVVNCMEKPLRVKIIDFGLARKSSDIVQGSCVQSLWYRAPEVILGQDFDCAIDMWSLGLIAVELALGCPLFPCRHEYELIKYIVDTIGSPPDYLLNCAVHVYKYFRVEGRLNQQTWRLKTPEEIAKETNLLFEDFRVFKLSSLDELLDMVVGQSIEKHKYVDLIKNMLALNKNERIEPKQVLEHAFFSTGQSSDVRTPGTSQQVDWDQDEEDTTESPSSVSSLVIEIDEDDDDIPITNNVTPQETGATNDGHPEDDNLVKEQKTYNNKKSSLKHFFKSAFSSFTRRAK